MEREEAEDWIKRLINEMKEDTPEYRDEVYEALDLAISDIELVKKYKQAMDDILRERKIKMVNIDMSLDTAREVVNSLRSLYALKDEEEEAIIALTTPKKVVMKEEGYDERADYYPYCPNCDNELVEPSYGFPRRFCPRCGQFLDWSDVL